MILSVTPSDLRGIITAPPSKSYAHRLVIAAFLSGEKTRVIGAGRSKDVAATLNALSSMGLSYERDGGDIVLSNERKERGAIADCFESGSTLRFLLPVAAALGEKIEFTGREGLLKRPINELIEALNRNGAEIEGLKVNGKLHSGNYLVDGSISSQYITGLLFALPILDGDSTIVFKNGFVSKAYVDITVDVLKKFGIEISETENGYKVKGGQKYRSPKTVTVEGDYSGAAFFLAAGALKGEVEVCGLDPVSRQGDRAITDVLKNFGAKVTIGQNSVKVSRGKLSGTETDIDPIPDLAQIISVVAAFAEGESVLKNVKRLRLKESDRCSAIEKMLESAGIRCEIKGDDLVIYGGKPKGAVFDGGNDHRTVMSSAILASFARGDSKITGAEAAEKSYPEFIEHMKKLKGAVDVEI